MQALAGDLALAGVAAAAGAVALVLHALALGAEVGDVGQRAVAAVAAVEERDLDGLLEDMEGMAQAGPFDAAEETPRQWGPRAVRIEDQAVNQPVEAVCEAGTAQDALAAAGQGPAFELLRPVLRSGL